MFTTCQFKIIYMSTTVPSSSWLVKHWQKLNLQQINKQKNVRFCFFQNILQAIIFYHRQKDI